MPISQRCSTTHRLSDLRRRHLWNCSDTIFRFIGKTPEQ
jgi:hypothetical protein